MPIKESTRAGGERRAVVRSVNAIIGIQALVTTAFAAVFGEADVFYFTAAVSFICWAIDWVLCRRFPKERDQNAMAAIAGFTVLLAYALAVSCAPAQAAPNVKCQNDVWGFLGGQIRTICDSPKRANGEWTRSRIVWTPAHQVPFTCSYSRYYSSCSGGYFVGDRINEQDEYPVNDENVLANEPGNLWGGRTV